MSLATFLRVHSNSVEVSFLSWQNTYPNLKTAGHIKLKIFLWTKLQENLLLAKYLISVAAPLTSVKWKISKNHLNSTELKIWLGIFLSASNYFLITSYYCFYNNLSKACVLICLISNFFSKNCCDNGKTDFENLN